MPRLPHRTSKRIASVRSGFCLLVPFAIFGLLLFAASCSRHPEDGVDRSAIKIGYLGDLSGPTFDFGQSAKNGVIMAADEINQIGGINGRKIDVVIQDDQGNPEVAAAMVNKLITEDRVVAVIVGGASGSSLAAGPKAQSARIPMISPSSTNPAVTQVGDYVFRICFIDAFQGEAMATFAAHTLKAKKAAIMLDFNSPYSRDLTEFFESSFTKLGGEVVNKQSYRQGDADFRGQLSSIKAAEPDVIYLPGYYGDIAVIAKQARQLGIAQLLLGGDGWDAPELWQLAGDSINGSYISSHYSAEDPAAAIKQFVRNYQLNYGNLSPDAHAALGYDAMRFLLNALQRAGVVEGSKVRDALAETKDFPGITGMISMDQHRNAVKSAVVLKLQDTKYIYQETIQPRSQVPGLKSQVPSPNQ